MINMIKRYFCKHEYHLLTTYKTDTDVSVGYKLEELCIIYCPKCKSEEVVPKHKYESIMEKQRIDKEYRND